MKKRYTSIWVLGVALSFLPGLMGTAAGAQAAKGKNWPKILTIASSPGGTAGNFLAAALGKQIEDKLGVPVTVTVSIGAAAARMVAKGEADLAVPNDVNFYNAVRGIGAFKKQGKLPLRYLTFTYTLLINLMARDGIDTFAKLKGKRVMFNYPTAPQFMAEGDALLKFHGMTRKDVVLLKSTGAKDVSDALVARTADAGMRAGPANGSPAIKDTARKVDLTFISLSKAEVDFVIKEAPYLSPATLPAGIYKGQAKAVKTTAIGQNLVIHRDIPDDLVFEIAKILMDSAGRNKPGNFTQYHKSLSWNLQDNVDQLYRRIGPFHPGVVRYLKTRGVWTPEMDQIQAEMLKLAQ
ncbi:MAG: TAXI family TRAP transporter solute-binding subunit [Desulfobacterales bacterium]|nr:TAXI family TRAP transporter solute-binding subunit [Desulfobacterales bacterium]